MIKHLTFTFFIFLSLLVQSQELSKKWQFEHIRKTDDTTNLRVIEENDNNASISLKLNQWLENKIRKNPSQWIWTHNRWK